MTALDLVHLITVLNRSEVRYVAVGGVAVGVHGYLRMTMDLDLVPDPDRANLEHLLAALSRLDASLPGAAGRGFDPAVEAGALRRGGNLTLDTPHGGLDVVQRLPGIPPYRELAASGGGRPRRSLDPRLLPRAPPDDEARGRPAAGPGGPGVAAGSLRAANGRPHD